MAFEHFKTQVYQYKALKEKHLPLAISGATIFNLFYFVLLIILEILTVLFFI